MHRFILCWPLAAVMFTGCDLEPPRASEPVHVNEAEEPFHEEYPHGPPGLADVDDSEPLGAIDCNEKQDTGYVKGNPFTITVVTVDGKPVERSTANAYYVMQQAAAAQGVNIKVVSGFRTMAEQQYLYNCYVNCNCNNCNLAAKPGYSNHQSGHALDLNSASPGVYTWLAAHAHEYGFEETVQGEPWHWEWWGGGPGGGPCGSCEPSCKGSKIVSEDCSEGDCAVFGANCVDDDLGPRCVFFACPAQGTAKVCVDEKTIGDCKDGQISTGDCSAFAAYCSTKLGDQAMCVSVFCAEPEQTPIPHDGCFLDGNPYHCDDKGQITFNPCPVGEQCTVYPDVHCEAGLGCPAEGEAKVCLGDTAIGTCNAGAVIEAADCGDFGSYCSTAGGTEPHCVFSLCVSSPDEVPEEHAICLPDGNLGLCFTDGSLKTTECAPNTKCIEGDFGAACVAEDEVTGGETPTTGGGASESGTPGSTGGGNTSGPGGSSGDESGAPVTGASGSDTAGTDADDAGCACADARPTGGAWLLLGLAGLLARRRRSA
jgi:hypothetical protein